MEPTIIERVQEALTLCEKELMVRIQERNENPTASPEWIRTIDHIIDQSIEQINDFNEVIEKWTK